MCRPCIHGSTRFRGAQVDSSSLQGRRRNSLAACRGRTRGDVAEIPVHFLQLDSTLQGQAAGENRPDLAAPGLGRRGRTKNHTACKRISGAGQRVEYSNTPYLAGAPGKLESHGRACSTSVCGHEAMPCVALSFPLMLVFCIAPRRRATTAVGKLRCIPVRANRMRGTLGRAAVVCGMPIG